MHEYIDIRRYVRCIIMRKLNETRLAHRTQTDAVVVMCFSNPTFKYGGVMNQTTQNVN